MLGRYAEVSGQINALSTSRPHLPTGKNSGVHRIGRLVGPRAALQGFREEKNFAPASI